MHNQNQGSGGGGGYSGGGAGHDNGNQGGGGGGGSYNSGEDQNNTAGVNEGHGKVVISLLGNPKLESAGATDFFVARFDANGTVTDAAHGAGAQIDSVNGLSAGKLGEFYLTGVYGNAVAIGEVNATGDNPFVNTFFLKLNEDLKADWLKTIGGGQLNRGEDVAVSAKGFPFFTGSYSGTSTFDEGTLTSKGSSDVYMAEFDPKGNLRQLRSHGGTSADAGKAVALDSQGGIILTGTYTGEADFFDGNHTCHEHGGTDVFVARYDYSMDAPETDYTVTVQPGADGQPKYFVNGEETPELKLVKGLRYRFHLDGNTTAEHPFYFATQGDGGDDYAWERTTGVENGRGTGGTVSIFLDDDAPAKLHYNCGEHPEMGGIIRVLGDERPRYRLSIAQLDGKANEIPGGTIETLLNGKPVSLDGDFEEGARLRVNLRELDGYTFEGWQGDLPTDANGTLPTDKTFVVTMDKDRSLQAYFSPYSFDLSEMMGEFEIKLKVAPTDEFGQRLEDNGSNASYGISFELDREPNEDGMHGSIKVNPEGAPDFDGDDIGDQIRGRFQAVPTSRTNLSFNIRNPEANHSGDGTEEWFPIYGGGMSMTVQIALRKGTGHWGGYVILRNDGETEQGDWGGQEMKSAFTITGSGD